MYILLVHSIDTLDACVCLVVGIGVYHNFYFSVVKIITTFNILYTCNHRTMIIQNIESGDFRSFVVIERYWTIFLFFEIW